MSKREITKISGIKNINELRDFALCLLVDLRKDKIDVTTAGVSAKLCENVVSTLKTQLEYHKHLGDIPNIDFLEGEKKIIKLNSQSLKSNAKKLENK